MHKRKKMLTLSAIVLSATLIIAAGTVGTALIIRKKHSRQVDKAVTDVADTYGFDTVEFGTYPQSRITDKELLQVLNGLEADWQSFGYLKEPANPDLDSADDYMRYADVEYQGIRYRGVTMDFYRDSMFTDDPINDSDAVALKKHGGYRCGTVYWFRCEPLQWLVLDPQTGMLLCERIVDAQPFNNTIWQRKTDTNDRNSDSLYYSACTDETCTYLAKDYSASSIRRWLNSDFKNTAFSDDECQKLTAVDLTDESYHTLIGETGFERMDGVPVRDDVTLLSYSDAVNPFYSFSTDPNQADSMREALYTDYAVIQGLFLTDNSRYSEWLLRTPGYASGYVCFVGRCPQRGNSFPGMYRDFFHDNPNGIFSIVSPYAEVTAADLGIRPVIYCPELTIGKSDPKSLVTTSEQETSAEPVAELAPENTWVDDDFSDDEYFTEQEDVSSRETETHRTPSTTKTGTKTSTGTKKQQPVPKKPSMTATSTTARNTYKLTVNGDSGTAGVSGSGFYDAGTKVTVTVTPLLGYAFRQWRSSDTSLLPNGSTATYSFTMPEGNVTLTAVTHSKLKVTVSAGTGIRSVTGGGVYAVGESVTVKAQLLPGYEFAGWTSENDELGSDQLVYTFPMPEHYVKMTATAVEKEHTVTAESSIGMSSVGEGEEYN